jgi:hypothetical protein
VIPHLLPAVGLGEEPPERGDQSAKAVTFGTGDLRLVPQCRVSLELPSGLIELDLKGLHLPPKLNEPGLGFPEMPKVRVMVSVHRPRSGTARGEGLLPGWLAGGGGRVVTRALLLGRGMSRRGGRRIHRRSGDEVLVAVVTTHTETDVLGPDPEVTPTVRTGGFEVLSHAESNSGRSERARSCRTGGRGSESLEADEADMLIVGDLREPIGRLTAMR